MRALQSSPDTTIKTSVPSPAIALMIVSTIFLTGCVTTLETARFRLRTTADASTFSVSENGALNVTNLSHSKPTRAAFSGASHLASAIGTAALPYASETSGAVKAASTLPALIPAFRTGTSTQP